MKAIQPIGSRIRENYEFLYKLAKNKSDKKRLKILNAANREEILALVEVSANILSSGFNLTTRQREKLLPYATYLRKLARSRSESGARKIIQKGDGFVFSSLLVPVLIEVVRGILNG